jgi:hypothetical protein
MRGLSMSRRSKTAVFQAEILLRHSLLKVIPEISHLRLLPITLRLRREQIPM